MKFITENLSDIKDIVEYNDDLESIDYDKNLKEIKRNKNIVILGNFDGVHIGHQIILQKAVKQAKEKNLKTIVYTFREYPKNQQTKITTCSEKAYLLNKNGIDYLYLEQFEKVRNYTPKEFVEKVLVDILNAAEVYCGFNFTFGKEFFKSATEMKGMFENSFGLDKISKNKAKAEKESVKSRFESFFDMKEKK